MVNPVYSQNSWTAAQADSGNNYTQAIQKDLDALTNALNDGGDAAGAQKAMTSLKKDIAQLMQANWQGAANADSAASYTQTIQKDLGVLAKALNGGNSADSKQALATLKKDLSGMKGAAARADNDSGAIDVKA